MRSTVLLVFGMTAMAVTGCATHHTESMADHFVHRGKPAWHLGDQQAGAGAPEDSLAAFMEKVRQLSLAIRPASKGTASVETSNPDLIAALQRETAAPSAETHRAVGEIYRQLGVLDLAYSHFAQAIKADSRDAASYDAMARVWRDWGLPSLGLGDAHRAIYYAPGSPSAYNTLGTLLQALGQPDAALGAYRQALTLAPDAPYALNNVCSALLVMHRPDEALAACERAVQLDPSLAAAQRNLAAAVAQTAVVGNFVAEAAVAASGHLVADAAPRADRDPAGVSTADTSRVIERAKVYPTADLDRR